MKVQITLTAHVADTKYNGIDLGKSQLEDLAAEVESGINEQRFALDDFDIVLCRVEATITT